MRGEFDEIDTPSAPAQVLKLRLAHQRVNAVSHFVEEGHRSSWINAVLRPDAAHQSRARYLALHRGVVQYFTSSKCELRSVHAFALSRNVVDVQNADGLVRVVSPVFQNVLFHIL